MKCSTYTFKQSSNIIFISKGGAPNENHRRKDIMGSLDSPRGGDMFTSMNSLPVGPPEFRPDGELMFTKGEHSSHRNLYDYEQKMKL